MNRDIKDKIGDFFSTLISIGSVTPDLHIYNVSIYKIEPFAMKYNFLDILAADENNIDIFKKIKQRIEMIGRDGFDGILFLITFKKGLKGMNNDGEIIKKIVYIYDDNRFKDIDEDGKNRSILIEVGKKNSKALDSLKETSGKIYPISFKEIEKYVDEGEVGKFFEILKKDNLSA